MFKTGSDSHVIRHSSRSLVTCYVVLDIRAVKIENINFCRVKVAPLNVFYVKFD